MKKITVEVKDKYINEFLEKLINLRDDEKMDERDITIFGLSIEDFKKHCIEEKG